jgi:hypothetical protein
MPAHQDSTVVASWCRHNGRNKRCGGNIISIRSSSFFLVHEAESWRGQKALDRLELVGGIEEETSIFGHFAGGAVSGKSCCFVFFCTCRKGVVGMVTVKRRPSMQKI